MKNIGLIPLFACVLIAWIQEPLAQQTGAQAGPPGSEILLLDVRQTKNGLVVSNAMNMTNSAGYDSQPKFSDNGRMVYYTKFLNGQTDIYQFRISTGETKAYMSTPESEYSPTLIPGKSGLSVIQVNKDGDQHVVWLNKKKKKSKRAKRLSELKQVGYHNWTGWPNLWAFVINEQQGDLYLENKKIKERLVHRNVGRAFITDPRNEQLYFTDKNSEPYRIKKIRVKNQNPIDVMALPLGVEDFTFDSKGRFWAGRDNTLFVSQDGQRWFIAKEFTHKNLNNITRVTVSPNGKKIAVVFNEVIEEQATSSGS